MSNETVTYKGYGARIEFDARDCILVGHVLGTAADTVSFHAETAAELVGRFHEAVDHYLAHCEATGRPPHKAYSGKLMLRVSPEIHARVAIRAAAQGKSINQWAAEVLDKG